MLSVSVNGLRLTSDRLRLLRPGASYSLAQQVVDGPGVVSPTGEESWVGRHKTSRKAFRSRKQSAYPVNRDVDPQNDPEQSVCQRLIQHWVDCYLVLLQGLIGVYQ
jgi:hypothetical protein